MKHGLLLPTTKGSCAILVAQVYHSGMLHSAFRAFAVRIGLPIPSVINATIGSALVSR